MSSQASLTDFEADVRRALECADPSAAATLTMRRLGPEIMGFLLGRLRDETLASEAFGMFAEDLWRTLPRLTLTVSMRAYAFALARNASRRLLDRAVRKDRRNVPLSAAGVFSQVAAEVRSATLPHLRTEMKSSIAQLRDQLSEEQQTLLSLRVDRQLAWNEIAHVFAGGRPLDPPTLRREGARLRKQFELAKGRLRKLALEAGLLES